MQDAEGQCALHLAADVGMVRLLCAHGADTSIQDNHGFTPLHIHVMMMRPDVVDALMGHSADPRIKELMRGRNALHLAADTGNFAIFSTVITESQVLVPIDEQDIDGNSALHILASNRHERRILHETDLPPSVSLQKCLMMLLDRGNYSRSSSFNCTSFTTPIFLSLYSFPSFSFYHALSTTTCIISIITRSFYEPTQSSWQQSTPLRLCKSKLTS